MINSVPIRRTQRESAGISTSHSWWFAHRVLQLSSGSWVAKSKVSLAQPACGLSCLPLKMMSFCSNQCSHRGEGEPSEILTCLQWGQPSLPHNALFCTPCGLGHYQDLLRKCPQLLCRNAVLLEETKHPYRISTKAKTWFPSRGSGVNTEVKRSWIFFFFFTFF